MAKQQLIDKICLTNVTDQDQQIEYFRRGFLRQTEWKPPAYIWMIEKFQYYNLEDIQEIYDDLKLKNEL